MNIKTLLVNPPISTSGLSVKSKTNEYMYPYSLIYLSNYLIKNGYKNVEIIDLNMVSEDYMYSRIRSSGPDIVGFTGVTENRFHVIDLIRRLRLRDLSKRSIVIVGGRHFSFTDVEALERVPNIDIIVRGEGEITLLEIVKTLENRSDFSDVDGITYRNESGIVRNEDRIVHKNLDDFAIDTDCLPKGGYSDFMTLRNWEKEGIKATPLQLGRGCTGSCIFCIHRFMLYRMRSLDNVIENIEFLMKKYNCNVFSFNDPSIYCDKNWMYDFCNRLISEKIGIKWYCEGRADVSKDLLGLMSSAGCVSLDIGVETGSDKIQGVIRKYKDTSNIIPIAKMCKELGIRTKMFFMISHPEETEEDAMETYDLVKELSKYIYRFGIGVSEIFPGTQLEKIAIEKGIIPRKFSWYDSSYNNGLPDLSSSRYDVIYVEKLNPKFIRDMINKKYYRLVINMAIQNGDAWRYIKEKSISELYDIAKKLI